MGRTVRPTLDSEGDGALICQCVGATNGAAKHLQQHYSGRPKEWTTEVWRAVHQFPSGGAGLANRMDTYVNGKFSNQIDLKDDIRLGTVGMPDTVGY